jgi:hypothetical protein
MSLLSEHFKHERLARQLRLSQLAVLAGYTNIGKGACRINVFETSGRIAPAVLSKLAAALGVSLPTVSALIAADEKNFLLDWNQWADHAIEPYLVIRLIPAVYRSELIPLEVKSLAEGEAFAASRAKHWSKRVCLVISRRYSMWLDEAGEVYARTEAVPGSPSGPGMTLGRKRQDQFLRKLTAEDFVARVIWPKRQ